MAPCLNGAANAGVVVNVALGVGPTGLIMPQLHPDVRHRS